MTAGPTPRLAAFDEAIRSIAELHSEHHGPTTAPQRLVNRISAVIARPYFVAFLTFGVSV
jgi:hypothetical protein